MAEDISIGKDGIWMTKGHADALKEFSDRMSRIAIGFGTEEDYKFRDSIAKKAHESEQRRLSLDDRSIPSGKCPADGRIDRPIYIITKNKRTLAVADGNGHAYKVYGEGYSALSSKCLPENRYNPSEYEFERGLSGMDF